jgi:uncharacterized iron-regulated membrane protein
VGHRLYRPGRPLMSRRTARSGWERARTSLFWIHLALGLAGGVAILTMCATGALLAMQPQILEWLERDQRTVVVPRDATRLAPSEVLAAGTRGFGRADMVTLTIAADPALAATVSLGREGLRYVDPYRGVVTGGGARGARQMFQWLTEFHRWFAAPSEWRPVARGFTGWSTLGFVVLAVSGVVIWVPRRVTGATLVRSMRPAWPATTTARHFNWHTVVGFWCAPVLFMLAFSGVIMAFPWANRMLFVAAGTPSPQAGRGEGGPARQRQQDGAGPAGRQPKAGEGAGEQRQPSGSSASGSAAPNFSTMDAAWTIAQQQLPTWGTIALRTQGRADGLLSFTITDAAHWNRFARSQLTISGTTGQVVRWEPYSEISQGQRWRGWIRFAHTGELGGLAGQILAGLASAGAVLLVWTGMSLAVRRLVRAVARRGVQSAQTYVREAKSGPEGLTRAEQSS